ncbi:MAG: DVUA0089 family protein [Tropicimonas sp.]|uniref:DVUA0089 family protein n=1 Tax=Tropicimonas sp. TaxID=2067044 RepID=UPI003A84D311
MKALPLAILLSTAAFSAQALDFSFTGNFTGDSDVQLFNFVIGAPSNIRLRSYSYAGGTMADGTGIAAGGFDPILVLFDGTGTLLEYHDDGPGPVDPDPDTNSKYDVNLPILSLAAGSYTVAIMQYNNFPTGISLSDGFQKSDPFFTSEFNCTNGQFCDINEDNRTSFWAFDILGVEAASMAAVPLPASLPLVLAGLGTFGIAARRRKA